MQMGSSQRNLAIAGGTVLLGAAVVASLLCGADSKKPGTERDPALFGFIQPLSASPGAGPLFESPGSMPAAASATSAPEAAGRMYAWRSIFERALAQRQERPMEGLRAMVQDQLRSGFGPDAVSAGMVTFDRYARYQRESEALYRTIDAAGNALALADGLAALKALRAQIFTPDETDLLFPHEEAYEQALIERMSMLADPGLSEEDRHARLQAWEATRSAESRMVEELRSGVVRLPLQWAVPAEEPPQEQNP
jgi:hypothetical protein